MTFLLIFSFGCQNKDNNTSDDVANLSIYLKPYNKYIGFSVISIEKDLNIGDEFIVNHDDYQHFVGALVYSKDGKLKKIINPNEKYIVESDDNIYQFLSEGSIVLAGKINVNNKEEKYLLDIYYNIDNYNTLFNQLNLNEANTNFSGGIGCDFIYENTFEQYLNNNINIIIKDYLNKNNKKLTDILNESSEFSEFATNSLNNSNITKYGLSTKKVLLKKYEELKY